MSTPVPSRALTPAEMVPVLPDPQRVVLAELPALCERIAQFREWAAGDPVELLRGRQVAVAIERLASRRQDAELLRVEERRLEVAIGRALGPRTIGGDRRSFNFKSEDETVDVFNDRDVAAWRLMGEYPGYVEDALAAGKTRHNPVVAFVHKRVAAERPVPTGVEVRYGRFQTTLGDVEPGSVDLILTDPPYAATYETEWHDLAVWASTVLKAGGSLITYAGQGTLPMAIAALNGPLRYWWTLAVTHSAGAQQLAGKGVLARWKPLLWFVKDQRGNREQVTDLIAGIAPDKSLHEWAQGAEELRPIIEKLTSPGDLVVDPFAGSGSFGRVAVDMGRRFVGADDPDSRP